MDKWNEVYAAMDFNTVKHSDILSYKKGFDWLKSCETIEDWGCGTGGFKFTDAITVVNFINIIYINKYLNIFINHKLNKLYVILILKLFHYLIYI